MDLNNEFWEFLEFIIFVCTVIEGYILATRHFRRFWVREMYLERDVSGFFATTFEQMKNRDPEQFKIATRMDAETFDLLLALVKEKLIKRSIRTPVSPECRLFLTLVYLSHGGSRQYLSMTFRMGLTSIRRIVLETCEVIWNVLCPIYIALPNTHEWERIAEDFENIWNLPHCVGAIDGKHINITCPPNSGSMFYNYKGSYSIILLGVCDANYTFTAVNIGAYGSQSDGGVLWASDFGQKLFKEQLALPQNKIVNGSNMNFPYYFVGDAAFPLKNYLMRPYPGTLLADDVQYFNKRLSRARRVIENTFGIMVARWRILQNTMQMNEVSAEKIVKACVVLHNFVKMHCGNYCPAEYVDRYDGNVVIEGLWRKEIKPLRSCKRVSSNNASRNAFQLRNDLKNYIFENKI